jgi:uncharacterized membrane protein YcfT
MYPLPPGSNREICFILSRHDMRDETPTLKAPILSTQMLRPGGEPRVAWVDYAKGFCIIMVVMMHSTLGVGNLLGGQGVLHEIVAFAKPFRMPDFFLIAGLFLSHTIDRDWRTFTDRKVIHFGYFYLLWLVIQVVVKYSGDGPAAIFNQFSFGLVEPLGTLWFIYLLPIFFVTTKLLRPAPRSLVWIAAALLETLRIKTGSTVVDEFASRYVYFLSGYFFSETIFALAAWARTHRRMALGGLAAWGALEAFLTFAPTPFANPAHYATLPVVSLAAGLAGACAVVVAASLLSDLRWAAWLRYCGRNSIVIYLAFFLPMAATRTIIVRTGYITDIDLAAALVTLAGVSVPLVLHAWVRNTRFKFLFDRPAMFRLSSGFKAGKLQPSKLA